MISFVAIPVDKKLHQKKINLTLKQLSFLSEDSLPSPSPPFTKELRWKKQKSYKFKANKI